MKGDCQLLESRADTAAFLQPADALLDHPAPGVSYAVEPHSLIVPGLLVVLMRDDRDDPLLLEPIAHALHAVALVASEFFGLMPLAFSFSASPDQARHRLADDRFHPL